MVSITISVPKDVRELMKQFPEVNWSGMVRTCISEKAKELALKREMLKQLKKEKPINDWAVKIVRDGRQK
ncbi:MAG: hypothetical protein V1645_04850 [archaeon]